MGEASRRQKLDPNYGKVPALRTQSLKYKHTAKILQELIEQFQVEFIELYNAETVPENYQTITGVCIAEEKFWSLRDFLI